MADKQSTCPQCGKQFTPWRRKKFCSEPCRRRAENARLGYLRGDEATHGAASDKIAKRLQRKQALRDFVRGDEGLEWTACNEVTRKLTAKGSPDAIGWAMLVEGQGWFGRIGKDFSFGPTNPSRVQKAVEARLRGQLFDKLEGEKSWPGTCWSLLSGSGAPQAEPAEERERPPPRRRSTRPSPALDDMLAEEEI